MPIHISPLDKNFIKLGRAARLIADDDPTVDSADIMDLFARAIFSGAFDLPEINDPKDIGKNGRSDESNWLQVPIVAPVDRVNDAQRRLDPPPVEYFGAGRATILSVMNSINGLPGDRAQWQQFFEASASTQDAFTALMRISYRQFPKAGQSFLEDVHAPKAKLRKWFELRELGIPSFLLEPITPPTSAKLNGVNLVNCKRNSELVEERAAEAKSPATNSKKRKQGRPKKSGWVFIEDFVRKLHKRYPKMQRKDLAYSSWTLAAKKFDEKDLPSLETIQRKIGEILSKE